MPDNRNFVLSIHMPGVVLQSLKINEVGARTLYLLCYDGQSLLNTGTLSKNSIRDARTPHPRKIVFNTIRYRSSETVERSGYFQSSVSYITVQIMFK